MDRNNASKWLVAAIAVAVICAVSVFWSIGEELKKSIKTEFPERYGAVTPESSLSAAILMGMYGAADRQGIALPNNCFAEQKKCAETLADLLAPGNTALKQQCTEGIEKMQSFSRKIENENSVILGFWSVIYSVQQSIVCPVFSEQQLPVYPIDGSERTETELLIAIPSQGPQDKCQSEKNLDFYGSVTAISGLNACLEQLGKIESGQ